MFLCFLQEPVSLVAMSDESPYVDLGDVEPVNLVSFAYQIASGMVVLHVYIHVQLFVHSKQQKILQKFYN